MHFRGATSSLLLTERFKEARAQLPKRRQFKRRSRFINKTLKIFKCFFIVSNCRSSRAALLVARGLQYRQIQEL